MTPSIVGAISLILTLVALVRGDCGCLKCSKGLKVISPPTSPVKVIMRETSSPYMPPPSIPSYPYPGTWQPPPQYGYTPPCPLVPHPPPPPPPPALPPSPLLSALIQVPLTPPPPSPFVTYMKATPDRIVIPGPKPCANYLPPAPPGPIWDTHPLTNCRRPKPPASLTLNLPVGMLQSYWPYRYALEPKTRSKRALYPRYRRPPRLPLLTPIHMFLRLIQRFLHHPLMHVVRLFTSGLPHQDPIEPPIVGSSPYFTSRSGSFPRERRMPRTGYLTSKSVLVDKLKQINEISSGFRRKRSLILHPDHESLPFFRVHEKEVSSGEEMVEVPLDVLRNQIRTDIVDDNDGRHEYLRPLQAKHLIPHSPIFYLLNTPLRMLSHFDQIRTQLRPVFHSIPLIFQNSRNYLKEISKNFHKHILHFTNNIVGDLSPPQSNQWGTPLPTARFRRSCENEDPDTCRDKRFILKAVDEKEVEEFLKEKLGDDEEASEEKPKKKLVLEKLKPKIVVDKGQAFLEIGDVKRPLFGKKYEKTVSKPHNPLDNENMKQKISDLIEKAKAMTATSVIVGSTYDSNMPVQVIKDKINQILCDIQELIETDFEKYLDLYEELLKLQNLKLVVTNEWKELLMQNRCNDIEGKIQILSVFQEIQYRRDAVMKIIAVALKEDRNFMTTKLIKMLVKMQKLQCIVLRIVEDFSEKMHLRTPFDTQKEIKYIEYLDGITFVEGEDRAELELTLKAQRDEELEKKVNLLESLRLLLEKADSGKSDEARAISELAKKLWESKNIEKLQKETISELNEKLTRGQKIRKELKILFDLQRQLDETEQEQKQLLQNTLVDVQDRRNTNDEKPVGTKLKEKRKSLQEKIVGIKKSKKQTRIARTKILPTTHTTILAQSKKEGKRPVKIITNGYTLGLNSGGWLIKGKVKEGNRASQEV